MNIVQTESVSSFRENYDAVFKNLVKGPVLLLQRSKLAAVLVSAMEWNRIVEELEFYRASRRAERTEVLERQLRLSNQRHEEMLADPTRCVGQAEYDRLLAEAGLAV